MAKLLSVLFAMCCLGVAFLSNNILGPGFWFWAISCAGLIVGVTAFIPTLAILGVVIAGLMSSIAVLAILLGLLAATVGGSFRLPEEQVILLALFGLAAFLGFILVIIQTKQLAQQKNR